MSKEFWNDSYKDDPQQTVVSDFFTEDEVENLVPGSALDLGCGTGDILLKLAAGGWSVTGVDWADEAIRLANKSAQEKGLNAAFFAGDSATWQAPQQFDLVFSTFAMPEGDGMPRVVANMIASLKPGGTLMICEWAQKMAAVWGFGEDELHAVDDYVAAMPGLAIETAEIRYVPEAFAADDMLGQAGRETYVSFIRATKKE